MTVRVATVSDISQMHAVRVSVRENVMSDYRVLTPELYADYIERKGRGWVIEQAGEIAGFAVADLEKASVWALFVRPESEGCGVGRCLHDAMLEWLRSEGVTRVTLFTSPNTRAARFYDAAGWIRSGSTEAGDIVYEKPLTDK